MPNKRNYVLKLISKELPAFTLMKLLLMLFFMAFIWFYTEDRNITLVASLFVLAISAVGYFIRKGTYSLYDDCIEFNDSKTGNQNYKVSLLRVANVYVKHSFLQPKKVGNIEIRLEEIKQPTATQRVLGAKEIMTDDNYPFKSIVMQNIKDYETQAKIIQDMVKVFKNRKKEVKPVLQGVTNVDELLPWGLKNDFSR